VRVLHRWICANISIVVESQGSGDRGSTAAESVFTSRTTVPQGYASLLGALCKEAGVCLSRKMVAHADKSEVDKRQ